MLALANPVNYGNQIPGKLPQQQDRVRTRSGDLVIGRSGDLNSQIRFLIEEIYLIAEG
jgi:hypothetical protein